MAIYQLVNVIALLLVAAAAGGRLPATSADSLMKSLGMTGPGVAAGTPPQVMLELYANTAQLPHQGPSFITAVPAKGDGRDNTFFFPLPNLADGEFVSDVEFHLHHSALRTSTRNRTILDGNLYKLIVEIRGTNISEIQLVDQHSSGWVRFKLGSETFDRLHQDCVDCAQAYIAVSVEAATLDNQKLKLKLHHGVNKPYRKSLLLYFCQVNKDSATAAPQLPMFSDESLHRVRRSLPDNSDSNSSNDNVTEAVTLDPEGCQRNSLMVNFEEIGWSSWVVAPAGYNAYSCSGGCGFPLGQHLNPTNHAVVQSIMRTIRGDHVPMSRCVPSSYASLSMLYFDSHSNVVLRNYDEMVVESCGCH